MWQGMVMAMPSFREGLDIVEEFYTEEAKSEQHQQTHDLAHVQDNQNGLKQSVYSVN